MYEKPKNNPPRQESFESLAERYRRELMSYYRKPESAVPAMIPQEKITPAPAPLAEDTRPLFPESFPTEVITLPQVEERRPRTVPEAIPETIPQKPAEASVPTEHPFEPGSPDEAITEMMRGNENSIGFLQVRASTGTNAIPVSGAHVTVYREEDGKKLLHQVMMTNKSGETPTVQLPAPPESLSESPGNSNSFSTYTILVHADGFQPVQNIRVPIFANILSIQPVSLIPLEEFPKNPNVPQVFIGQEPNL